LEVLIRERWHAGRAKETVAGDRGGSPPRRETRRRRPRSGDEIRHARFGFVLLAEWAGWLGAHPDTVRALDAFLPGAFVALEKALSGVGASANGYGDDDRALGSPDPARLPETFYVTVEQAIVPGLDRLGLAASLAWRSRPATASP
jgi:hypothetical protein